MLLYYNNLCSIWQWCTLFYIYFLTGFKKGRNLKKVGSRANDTAELFFEDVRLPESAILGGFNRGFYQLMNELPQVGFTFSAPLWFGLSCVLKWLYLLAGITFHFVFAPRRNAWVWLLTLPLLVNGCLKKPENTSCKERLLEEPFRGSVWSEKLTHNSNNTFVFFKN